MLPFSFLLSAETTPPSSGLSPLPQRQTLWAKNNCQQLTLGCEPSPLVIRCTCEETSCATTYVMQWFQPYRSGGPYSQTVQGKCCVHSAENERCRRLVGTKRRWGVTGDSPAATCFETTAKTFSNRNKIRNIRNWSSITYPNSRGWSDVSRTGGFFASASYNQWTRFTTKS